MSKRERRLKRMKTKATRATKQRASDTDRSPDDFDVVAAFTLDPDYAAERGWAETKVNEAGETLYLLSGAGASALMGLLAYKMRKDADEKAGQNHTGDGFPQKPR